MSLAISQIHDTLLDYGYQEIITLCKTNQRLISDVCRSEAFWAKKLSRDYPNVNFKQLVGDKSYVNLAALIVYLDSIGVDTSNILQQKTLVLTRTDPSTYYHLITDREIATTTNPISHPIDKIPPAIAYLKNLETLVITHQNSTTLPDSIGQLTNLKYLDLSFNRIKELPESMRRLTQLRTLLLPGNQLERLPSAIGKLSKLVLLDVSGNKLNRLPYTLSGMKSLEQLLLERNKLTELPTVIGGLSQLRTLDVSFNHLSTLPKSIGQLQKLEMISLQGNPMRILPIELFNISDLEIGFPPTERLEVPGL